MLAQIIQMMAFTQIMAIWTSAITLYRTTLRPQSVDSLDGGSFTRGFSAVGRSGKKKSRWLEIYPKIILEMYHKTLLLWFQK